MDRTPFIQISKSLLAYGVYYPCQSDFQNGAGANFSGEFSTLKAEIATAEAKALVLENSIQTQDANSDRLSERTTNLEAQIRDEKSARATILSEAYDYGWSAMNPGVTYTWGARRTAPPPL